MWDKIIVALVILQCVLVSVYILFKIPFTFRLAVEVSTQISLWFDGINMGFDWDYVRHGKKSREAQFNA